MRTPWLGGCAFCIEGTVPGAVTDTPERQLPPSSVVFVTGLPLTAQCRAGIDAGILRSVGPLKRITETGIGLDDGRTVPADVILWATGYGASASTLGAMRAGPAAAIQAVRQLNIREER